MNMNSLVDVVLYIHRRDGVSFFENPTICAYYRSMLRVYESKPRLDEGELYGIFRDCLINDGWVNGSDLDKKQYLELYETLEYTSDEFKKAFEVGIVLVDKLAGMI